MQQSPAKVHVIPATGNDGEKSIMLKYATHFKFIGYMSLHHNHI